MLAAFERLLPGLLGPVLDLVGDRADLLVLDLGGRHEEPGDEADGDGADREPERVLLGHALDAPGLALDLAAVRRRPGHLLLRGADLVGNRVLRPRLDVGLVAERLDRVAHPGAGLLYVLPDRARVFAHSTSSFVLSMACSGTGGPAFWILPLPVSASAAATAPYTTATSSAASQSGMAESSAAITHVVSAANAPTPNSPAPPNMPAPTPACFPFSASSAFARSIFLLTSVVVSSESF